MGKFIKITGLLYKKREHGRVNPNEIDQEETYTITINSDFLHNVRPIKFYDSKNRLWMRYHVNTIANNTISTHIISKEDFEKLIDVITTDPDFGLIEI